MCAARPGQSCLACKEKAAHIEITENIKEIRNFLFPSRDNFGDENCAAESIYIEHLIICIFFPLT
jgi:hypothetical protein